MQSLTVASTDHILKSVCMLHIEYYVIMFSHVGAYCLLHSAHLAAKDEKLQGRNAFKLLDLTIFVLKLINSS